MPLEPDGLNRGVLQMTELTLETELTLDMPQRSANQPHVAIALVLDVSRSMNIPEEGGRRIDLLNDGLNTMIREMKVDSRLKNIIDVAIYTFGESSLHNPYQGFRSIADMEEIYLVANQNSTYITGTLEMAVEHVKERSKQYQVAGGGAYKPWIVVITDGEFHDNDSELNRVGFVMKQREKRGKQHFFGMGICKDFNREQLELFADDKGRVQRIKPSLLPEFFSWIGKSMKAISEKNPGEATTLPPFPTNILA